MAKEINTGSKMNGLFRFNEKDWVAGFYAGTQKIKHGKALILTTLDGEKAVGVPDFTTIKDVPEKIEEGDFLLLQLKGMEQSKSTNMEYMNIASRAWRLEESEKEEWDSERGNVREILELLPDFEPEDDKPEAGVEEESISDDDLPF